MIDILNIQETVISRGLKGKYILLYGKPKTGKTSFSKSMPKNLLIAFERGYNLLSGIKAADVQSWADFKQIIRQLEKPAAREMYDSITIDTLTIAWQLCEDYICMQNDVQHIGEIDFGAGYVAAGREFANCLRKITMLGYGILLITHSISRYETVIQDGKEVQVEIITPDIPRRAEEIANGLVDIIGYISPEKTNDGKLKRYLYTRSTPLIFAGSRFQHLAEKIPFGYNELVNAIEEAINKSEQEGEAVTDALIFPTREVLDFKQIRLEAESLWAKLVEKNPDNANVILKKVEKIFNKKIRLSEITEDQAELFNLVLIEMRELSNEE